MPREDCISLSPEVGEIWIKILNCMKAFILRSRTVNSNDGVNNHIKNAYKTVKPPSYRPRKFNKAHLHELLTKLISKFSLSEQNEVDDHKYEPDSESKLLAHSTPVNAINPGCIRKLMSTPDKGKATSNKKQTAFSYEVTTNLKTYRECSQHVIY